MWLKLFAFVGLIAMCSCGYALKMNEEIELDGNGWMSAQTDSYSVYDRVNGYGDSQKYSRELASGNEFASLKSTYVYRNSKGIKDVNFSGQYQAGLIMPEGIHHSISIQSNNSINSSGIVSYECGDIEVAQTYYDIEALSGNLSEAVKDYSNGAPEIVATTKLQGNLTLINELEESQRKSCAAGVLLEKVDSVEMRGINQVKEIQVKGPTTIIIDGKEASKEVQASYLQREAADLISSAINEADFEEALQVIDKALSIDSEDSNGWTNKGYVLYRLNRVELAEDAYDEALNLDPDNVIAIFGKADSLFNRQQYRKSIEYYDRGLNLAPSRNANYWFNKSVAHYQLGEYEDADISINKYIRSNEDDSQGILFEALIQYKMNNFIGAIESWDKGLQMLPESADLGIEYLYKGMAYSRLNRIDEAIASFDKAKSLDPTLTQRADEQIYLARQLSAGPTTAAPIPSPSADTGTDRSSLDNEI